MEANYPPISDLLAGFFGFFGFFERDFRDFDFYLGAYDAYKALRDGQASRLGAQSFVEKTENELALPVEQLPNRLSKLACIAAYAEPHEYGHLAPTCEDRELENFRTLLQVSLDRLWSNCRNLSRKQAREGGHLQCMQARGGVEAPRVQSLASKQLLFQRKTTEGELDYVMRLLTAYEFKFADLGLQRDQASRGRTELRRKLVELVHAIGEKQPTFGGRMLIKTAGRAAVNTIEYGPPPQRFYLTLGSSMAGGYLHQIGSSRSISWNPDVRLKNVHSLFTGHPELFTTTVSFGAEVAILPLSGTIFQTSFGLRTGYQFSSVDKIGTSSCLREQANRDTRVCSNWVIQAPINLALFERVRL